MFELLEIVVCTLVCRLRRKLSREICFAEDGTLTVFT